MKMEEFSHNIQRTIIRKSEETNGNEAEYSSNIKAVPTTQC